VSDPGEIARAVREALGSLARAPEGGLAARFTAPLVTAIVAEAVDDARLVPALAEVSSALERVGVPRGRQFVLLGHDGAASAPDVRARAAELRRLVAGLVLQRGRVERPQHPRHAGLLRRAQPVH